MVLKRSYSLWAPIYDCIVAAPTDKWRRQSLDLLNRDEHHQVLISGIGSGLDIPYLKPDIHWLGVDFNQAMLNKAKKKISPQKNIKLELINASVEQLPFRDNQFEAVVAHLILAVVEHPQLAFAEQIRVLKPGGILIILDKFLRPGQIAPLRRLINPITKLLITRFDLVFENLMDNYNNLEIKQDKALKPGNWFRHIIVKKID